MKKPLLLAFVLAFALTLTACGNTPTNGGDNNVSETTQPPANDTPTTTDPPGGNEIPTTTEPPVSDIPDTSGPSISELKATLLIHEYIIDVTPVTIPEPLLAGITELVEQNGFEYNLILYRIRYKSDEYEVMGYVAAPANFMEREYPVLIFNRGGNRNFGALTHGDMLVFAMRGYIVLGSQYRGVAGGTGMEQFGGDDINDVLRLIDISESFEFAQQGGVYMFGASRGGMMTYIASRMDDRIRAATVWAGLSNAFDGFHEREQAMQQVFIDLVGGTPDEMPEEFERRSAVFWADEIRVPLLIGHGGDDDWRAPTHHALQMAEALERYGKPHRLIIYPEKDHSFGLEFLDEMDDWFRAHPIMGW